MNSLTVGQIVRNYPLPSGEFDTFEILSFEGDVVTVSNTKDIGEPETWSRSQIELFTFKGTCGSYSIGDTVRAFGYEGTWEVLHFAQDYRSSTQAEWSASLLHENGKTRLFYPAHLIKKA